MRHLKFKFLFTATILLYPICCSSQSGIIGGHEYVDLGLPSGLLWGKCNIGASSQEKYGSYYTWGDVVEHSYTSYTEYNYKYYKKETIKEVDEDGFETEKTYEGYTKYVMESQSEKLGFKGFYDNKHVLDMEDDVANVKWGNGWHMPSKDDFNELLNSCTWKWCSLNNINGYKVTGPNGNYIFLPAGGSKGQYSSQTGAGTSLSYFSNTLDSVEVCFWDDHGYYSGAYCLNNIPAIGAGVRYCAFTIRPVFDKPQLVSEIALSPSNLTIHVDATSTIEVVIVPDDATTKDVTWTSSDESVATVTNGVVTAIKVGEATITATTTDGTNLSATCDVVVLPIIATGISLDKQTLELAEGDTYQLTATIIPENTSDPSVEWSSSNEDVAMVSSKGKVVALADGTTVITAKTTDGSDLSASCDVTVEKPSGINDVYDLEKCEYIYDITGRKLKNKKPGVNILKMSDGTTRKVIIK